ncbi:MULTISPECIES: NRDE family protein [unclassified Tenacibaculum]|uniref:NRDE family protein n=1 Tax=unclassified Tenacibaculum TaxID=2635139 RepID=UPI001F15E740|nr:MULTISPECIES: NRDE family protein [unclassified Tenacibaculum]MCF2875919.1 NRDE family protein [Tenacibaculum sp. Cn5-1]MCF2935994.1 NRDE family protein [Tenacibaculum sp. Cn5-34]MCG7512555.1 NRDE family protein [Tenacibaculum sp. Cn5-46]
MCTVTYLPLGNNDFILTSNRDEDPKRRTIPPKEYNEDGIKLKYPKDELAGGTWIGLSEKNRLICLLNGGFTKHVRAASYKMSRGIIVKELLKVNNPVEIINQFDFNGIEPFTIVLVDWEKTLNAYELVWDGEEKHFQELGDQPKIWSSSTLYDEGMKQLRKDWFADWLKENTEISQENIVAFHQDDTRGEEGVSLKMKRSKVETVSTTSVKKEKNHVTMDYYIVD